jgi:hypothetical protein
LLPPKKYASKNDSAKIVQPGAFPGEFLIAFSCAAGAKSAFFACAVPLPVSKTGRQ